MIAPRALVAWTIGPILVGGKEPNYFSFADNLGIIGSSILFKLLLRIRALRHRHSADDVPILSLPEQGMRDA